MTREDFVVDTDTYLLRGRRYVDNVKNRLCKNYQVGEDDLNDGWCGRMYEKPI